jgi:hypothetical protein
MNRFHAVACILLSLAASRQAAAQLIMELSGTPGSSIVEFILSGEDVATDSFESVLGIGFDIVDDFNPFPPAANGSDFGRFVIQTGSASLSNITQDRAVAVSNLFLQDSELFGVDRFGVRAGVIPIFTGDTISWTGSGTIDLSTKGLTFSDLRVGSGVGVVDLAGVAVGIDGVLQIVPEPAAALLLSPLGFTWVASRRRQE